MLNVVFHARKTTRNDTNTAEPNADTSVLAGTAFVDDARQSGGVIFLLVLFHRDPDFKSPEEIWLR